MAKYSYGSTNRLRVRRLLAAILEFVETGETAKEVSVRWLDTDTEPPQLRVQARRRFFEQLTRNGEGEALTAEQVRDALSHYLPDYLGILEDERTTTQGSEEWQFKLMLWSREPAKNLSQFDKRWEECRPDKSKLMASQDSSSATVLAAEKPPHCFISYRSQDPDQVLAQTFQTALEAEGYSAFMAGASLRLGEDWVQRIDQELNTCDYMLVLLSEQAALSEMVTEEVKRARQRQEQTGRPWILPIRVNFPLDAPLNYDLRGYLHSIQQREWKSPADTPWILMEVLDLLRTGALQAIQPMTDLERMDRVPIVPSLTEQESVQMPPLPVAEPELPGGQVDLASQFYVERAGIEDLCYEAIIKPGALIRIRAPRQMGKTSLMSRVLRYAEQQGSLGVALSFQIADSMVFRDLDRFLRWFVAIVGRRLKLPHRLNDYWDEEVFGSKGSCTAYFEEYLLPSLEQPLTLCLDEVDMVFEHKATAENFFGLLRSWHEMGKTSEQWKQFRLVVVHSTEAYIPMNINQSPFNVGLPIELPEFSSEQVDELARRHGLRWNTSQIGRLMGMIGGHPYLVRLALYQIARQDMTLDGLLSRAATESGLYSDHLRRHLWNLEQRPSLAAAVRQLVQSDGPVRLESVVAYQLHSMGLVDLQGNEVTFRSELYRLYFADRLGS